MEQFLVLLIPVCILWSWLSPIGFMNRRVEGSIIQIMQIPLLAKIKRHAVRNAVTSIVSVILVVRDVASPWWLLVVAASVIGLLSFPQSYVVTSRGIRVVPGAFRRWTEFAGVYRSPAGAKLQNIGRGRDLPIWLSGSRGDDEFVHLLRTLVRDSYKGKTDLQARSIVHESTRIDVPELGAISAFTQDH